MTNQKGTETDSTDESNPEHEEPKRFFTRRKFLALLGGAVIGGVGTVGYTFFVEPFWVRTRHLEIPIPNLPTNWVGKKIMQISDLHIGELVPSDFLVRVLKESRHLEPDLIVITGDLTDADVWGNTWENDEAIKVLKHLPKSKHGTIMVMGNHDYGVNWMDTARADDLEKKLKDSGVTVLRNETTNVDGLGVGGIDDIWSPKFRGIEDIMDFDLPNLHLMLAHNPDVCDYGIWKGFEGLFLSGHTHGGQCKPPFLPPPLLPVLNRQYTKGIFDLGKNQTLHINPGLGFIQQVRFNVRPEITVIKLKSA